MKKRFFLFILCALGMAFLMEEIPSVVLQGPHLWDRVGVLFFIVWYGTALGLTFLLLRNKPTWTAVVTGIVFGTLVEIFFFRKHAPIIHQILYGLMFYIPFKIDKVRQGKERFTGGQIALSFALFILALLPLWLFRHP